MSKITRLDQITYGADDIFRVAGVFEGKARVCWIDRLSDGRVQIMRVNGGHVVELYRSKEFEEKLLTGKIRIMCMERE